MFDEMRVVAARQSSLSPRQILQLATMNGARALGLQGKVGELRPGAKADLIVIPLSAGKDIYESVVQHRGDVLASMIGGRWAVSPNGAKASSLHPNAVPCPP